MAADRDSGHSTSPHVNVRPNGRFRVRSRQPDRARSFDRFWQQQSLEAPWSNVRDQPKAASAPNKPNTLLNAIDS